jgi:hypothetical protein
VTRSAADDPADPRGSSDVAVADLPSTSGAHWANRDNAALRQTPYRRPPAVNSFPDGGDDAPLSPAIYLPPETVDGADGNWFGDRARTPPDQTEYDRTGDRGEYDRTVDDRTESDGVPAEPAAPDYGPAPPASPGRASFGFTAGPISPSGWSAAATDSTASPARGGNAEHATEPAVPGAGVGEFISGPGREIRPHRATRRDPPAHDHDDNPPRSTPHTAPPRRSRTVTVAGSALAALVLLGGTVAGVVFFSGSDKTLNSVLQLGAGEIDGKTATAPLDGRTAASFELVAATTKVTVKTQDLGDDLYKITSAGDSGTVPSPVLSDDRVQLHLTPDGDGASGRVEVLLSGKVRWALRFIGGADEQIVDLAGGRVSSIDVIGGSRRFELSLPKPAGTVPVRVTGAVEDFSITSPKDSPVRVQVDSGAKTVAAGDRTLRDVKPGSTLTPKDWQVQNRYDVDAASRITLLSVGTR